MLISIQIRTKPKPVVMVHEALCDWPLPACLLFTSSFFVFCLLQQTFFWSYRTRSQACSCFQASPGWLLCLECWSTKSFHGCSFSLERAQLRCICAESPSTTVLLSWLMGISCLLPVSSHLVVCFMREKAEAFISRESEKTELLAQARSDKRAGGWWCLV